MSRTRKDRPYWVRDNDANEERYAYHNHSRLDEDLVRYKKVYNNVPDLDFAEIATEMVTTIGWHINEFGEDVYSEYTYERTVYKEKAYEPPVYEKVIYGHVPDHCTIDEDRTSNNKNFHRFQIPCGHRVHLNRWNRPKNVSEKRVYHSSRRVKEQTPLTNVTKLYNNGENVEGYDHPNLNTRNQMHWGWWD